jgi:hypothetical protein
MEHNKAPGLNGFLAKFYQKFWDVIKEDLITMFHGSYVGDLSIFSLNFGVYHVDTKNTRCFSDPTIPTYLPSECQFQDIYQGCYNSISFGTFIIKNGSQIRFWEDIWLGTSLFARPISLSMPHSST